MKAGRIHRVWNSIENGKRKQKKTKVNNSRTV